MRTRYRVYEREFPYFLTDTVVAWLPIFSHVEFASAILDSWRFLQQERGVRILGYTIMENHVHWIASADELPKEIARFKSYTARRIIDRLQTNGYETLLAELRHFKLRHRVDQSYQVWQEGSHPKQIRDEATLLQKLEYMHNNPVRRGYVDDPCHWRYSSARSYAGMQGLMPVEMDW